MTKRTPKKSPAKKGRATAKRRPVSRKRRHPFKRLLIWLLVIALLLGGAGMLWLNHDVKQRFESHEWVLPARVYSRPESLYRGRELQADNLLKLLKLMRYRNDARVLSPGSYHYSGNRFVIYTRGFSDTDGGEPARRLILTLSNGKISRLTDSKGNAIAVARIEPLQIGSIHPGFNQDRIFVHLDDVPPMLVKLLLDTEDRGFYHNIGISFKGMARALYVDIKTGSFSQGGSTLTQQLVKNLWLTNSRTILRKLVEIPMAVLLELNYSKQQILEAYLNEAYLGQDGGRAIKGMGLGAQFYFGRPLEELSTPQLAMLVALLRGPSWYDPRQHPKRALARRNDVLHNAVEVGDLSRADYNKLRAEPLTVVPKGKSALYAFPAFIDLVKRQLDRDYQGKTLARDGLQIHSTLDVLSQLAAEKALSSFLKRKDPTNKHGLNGAVVMVSPNQGDVLALVGDRDPRRAGFNRALDAVRPIGSLAKPFVVLTALADKRYTLATKVPDEPLKVPLANGNVWSPDNFDHESWGPISLLKALVDSRNQAMAHVGMAVGPASIVATLHKLGLNKDIPPYPSIILGGFNLTPLQVAMAYQPIANGGFQTPLRSITDVLDKNGNPLVRYPATSNQVIPADMAYLTEWAMQKVVSDGTGRYAGKRLPQLHLAGKTGTSNKLRDSWFAGFSGSALTVVWLGRDDNGSTGLTGNSGALRVWEPLMAAVPQQPLQLHRPDNVEMVWMNPDGVRASGPSCSGSKEYPLLKSSVPTESDGCGTINNVGKGVVDWFKGLFGH